MNVFEIILSEKNEILKKTQENFDKIERYQGFVPKFSDFIKVRKENKANIIAEIKKSSPSLGKIINTTTIELARIYEKTGVVGISVLTQERLFSGSILDLIEVRNNFPKISILCKDFIFSKLQIDLAKKAGASSVLLIVKMLDKSDFIDLFNYCKEVEIEAFVEVFDESDVKIANEVFAKIVMINSRNLTNLSVDISRFDRLSGLISSQALKIFASGIENADFVEANCDKCSAMLIGTSLLKDGVENVERKLSSLVNLKN